jgi:hypothetical protein
MSEQSTAVAVQQPAQAPPTVQHRAAGLLRPIAPTGEIIAAQNDARAFIASALEKGRDYGVIPGTGDKATLLKPGSERICAGFGVRVVPEIVEMEIDHDREVPWTKRKKKWNNRHKGDKTFEWDSESGVSYGLYRYVVRCDLFQIDTGLLLGSGIGSASTMESKYVDRPRDAENTVLKMAKKRAQIDATLTTFGLSDQFTQDLDDFREDFAQEAVAEVQTAPAVTLASEAQLTDLRAQAKANGPESVAWLETKIAAGIPEEDVPLVFGALREQADILRRARRGRQQAESAPALDSQEATVAAGNIDALSDEDILFGREG